MKKILAVGVMGIAGSAHAGSTPVDSAQVPALVTLFLLAVGVTVLRVVAHHLFRDPATM